MPGRIQIIHLRERRRHLAPIRRKEAPLIAVNAVLLTLAVIVAWGRLGPYPLT